MGIFLRRQGKNTVLRNALEYETHSLISNFLKIILSNNILCNFMQFYVMPVMDIGVSHGIVACYPSVNILLGTLRNYGVLYNSFFIAAMKPCFPGELHWRTRVNSDTARRTVNSSRCGGTSSFSRPCASCIVLRARRSTTALHGVEAGLSNYCTDCACETKCRCC